jgi:hypothetical protein
VEPGRAGFLARKGLTESDVANDLLIYELFGLADLVEDGTLEPLGGNVYRFTRDYVHDPFFKPSPLAKPNWKIRLGPTWTASAGVVIRLLDLSGPAPHVPKPHQQSFTFQFDLESAYSGYFGGVRPTGNKGPVDPVLDAGSDQTTVEGTKVTLVAKLRNKFKLQRMPFNWVQIAGPVVTLSDRRSLTPTFVAPEVGGLATLTFRIIATDGCETFSDDVNVFVQGQAFWDTFTGEDWDTMDGTGWDIFGPEE